MELGCCSLMDVIQFRFKNKIEWKENELDTLTLQLILPILEIHQQNFIHRDIKPHNIIYSKNDRSWKLTDFGLA